MGKKPQNLLTLNNDLPGPGQTRLTAIFKTEIEIVRAFVKLRRLFMSNTELAGWLDELESKYDKQFKVVLDAIRKLMETPARDRKEIGFRSPS